ncbi:hypothetical protein BP6252_02740 [Coleophoma cylindrospora]|uniref:BZIP domain-containing protein n=1 Tax=Coleophoma cylindrospora TaxID=1849047 RepID=A0A3D8SFM1_9HELO|nr:hypothetical protein BP6252_02740 [Coleophoma cylindrospora]
MNAVTGTQDDSKPQKRVLTEARREQNRLAQKVYRQRQKARRVESRQNAAPVPGRLARLRPKELGSAVSRADLDTGAATFQFCKPLLAQGQHETEADLIQHISYPVPELCNPTNFSSPILSSTSFLSDDFSTLTDIAGSNTLSSWTVNDFTEFQDWALGGEQCTQDIVLDSLESYQSSETIFNGSSLQGNPKSAPWHPVINGLGLRKAPLESNLQNATSAHTATRDIAVLDAPMTWEVLVPTKTRSASLEDIIAAGLQALALNDPLFSKDQNFNITRTSPPSPYLNPLPNASTRTLSACIQNANIIGLFATVSAQPYCMTPSSFYRPWSSNDDLPLLLATASKSNLPLALRPTVQQILYQHPSFLDLIPMPDFRAKVISIALGQGTARPETSKLNLLELKKDMFQGGLVYNGNTQSGPSQPWDIRCWEAAGWFVRKWNMLFDKDV